MIENIKLVDREVYLVLKPNDLIERLSINQWNDFITRYENDNLSLVTPYNEKYDGWFFVTTTLKNIIENHSLYDLRFLCEFRTEHHLTFKNKNKSI